MDIEIKEIKKIDKEGQWMISYLDNEIKKNIGEIVVAQIAPGKIRGNHYHKECVEYFSIIDGSMTLILEDINTREKKHIELDSKNEKVKIVRIGPHISHKVENNTQNTSIFIEIPTLPYSKKGKDTFPHPIR